MKCMCVCGCGCVCGGGGGGGGGGGRKEEEAEDKSVRWINEVAEWEGTFCRDQRSGPLMGNLPASDSGQQSYLDVNRKKGKRRKVMRQV